MSSTGIISSTTSHHHSGDAAGLEEAARKAAEEDRLKKIRRMEQIKRVIEKRQTNLEYIKSCYEGGHCWLNTVILERRDLDDFYQPGVLDKRVQQYFYLGLGLARVVNLGDGVMALRGCSQLMEEWEYHFASPAVQSMKFMLSRSTDSHFPTTVNAPLETDVKPTVARVGQKVVYEHLITPHIPCNLDYFQVVFALAEVLQQAYARFDVKELAQHEHLFAALVKFDHRIKHHVVNLIGKELTGLSMTHASRSLASLRS